MAMAVALLTLTPPPPPPPPGAPPRPAPTTPACLQVCGGLSRTCADLGADAHPKSWVRCIVEKVGGPWGRPQHALEGRLRRGWGAPWGQEGGGGCARMGPSGQHVQMPCGLFSG
jgi:hypothetical protein